MSLKTSDPLVPRLSLLPFLDLVWSFVGILVVIFALQSPNPPHSGRPLAVDLLAICQRDGEVWLYRDPQAAPRLYPDPELGRLLEDLAIPVEGTRNLVFAFSRDCLTTRRLFEESFGHFTTRTRPEAPNRAVVRLVLRPLAASPQAAEQLVEAWRGHGD